MRITPSKKLRSESRSTILMSAKITNKRQRIGSHGQRFLLTQTF